MRIWLALGLLVICIDTAFAVDWPSRYRLVEGTESADGRYGIIAWDGIGLEEGGGSEIEQETTYLAEIKTRRVIGEIRGASYYWPHNRLYLQTVWSSDSKWCVASYEGRWSFKTLHLLRVEDGTLAQHDLGSRINLVCDQVASAELTCYFRFGRAGRLEVVAFGTDRPKGIDDEDGRFLFFRGTYDGMSGRWLRSKARPLAWAEYYRINNSFASGVTTEDGLVSESSEDLDAHLNEVYRGVREFLPSGRFEALRKEQRHWLVGLNKLEAGVEKDRRVVVRTKILEALLWAST